MKSDSLSPWGMPIADYVEIAPLEKSFDAQISLPGSKSYTNRALVLAAVAEGSSCLSSPLFSDDSYWCTDALKKLGVKVETNKDQDTITVHGIGKGGLKVMDQSQLPYIGSAGTIARFLPGIVAAKAEQPVTLTSSEQLAKRPVAEMIKAMQQLGAVITMDNDVSFPMYIEGGGLKGGQATVSGAVSSQYISGLLMAAPLCQEAVTITISDYIVQSDYVRMTIDLMKAFGVSVKHNEEFTEFKIEPQAYIGKDMQLEADASTATYFFGLAAATQSSITITNLNPNTLQPDIEFVTYLKKLGCSTHIDGLKYHLQGPAKLTGDVVFDFNACSDSTPALMGIAPFADGTIEVRGVKHIRAHECDRLSVMRDNLVKAGIEVEEFDDGLKVTPGTLQHVTVSPHDDHRMAMAFAMMGAAGKGAKILEPACVSKTCPNFYELLQKIGVKCTVAR